ncbi:MAG: PAS domain-containing sensor histidine kinase [Bacteroidota bacterium]
MRPNKKAFHIALKIALIYLVISVIWILTSDHLSVLLSSNQNTLLRIQNWKGIAFVLVSGILIYYLIFREIKLKQDYIHLLNKENQLHNALIKNLPNVDVFLFNREKEILYQEGNEIESLTIEPGPIVGIKTVAQIPLDKASLEKIDVKCDQILKGKSVKMEIHYLGSYFELRGAPLKKNGKDIYAGLLMFVNITPQKRMMQDIADKMREYEALYEEYLSQSEALRKNYEQLQASNNKLAYSEKKYRTFIEQTNDGVYHFDFKEPVSINLPYKEQVKRIYQDTMLSYCNDTFVKMYGAKSKDELLGKNLLFLYGNDENANWEANIRFIKNNYLLLSEETEELDTEGNYKYFLNNTMGIVEEGFLKVIWGTQTDITQRKANEKALIREKNNARDSQKKYADLFNNLNDGVLLYEIDYEKPEPGIIHEMNDEICRILETDRTELSGSSVMDFIKESEKENALKRSKDHLKGKQQFFEVTLVSKSGKNIPCEAKTSIVEYDKKKMVLAIVRDITQRKKMEKALEKERDKAQESDRLKSAFLANMSHEIRTPMNSIIGFSEMLDDESATAEEHQQYASIIRSNSNNLLRIIDDILNIARIETRQVAYYYSYFALNQLIDEIATHITYSIRNKDKNVKVVKTKGLKDTEDMIYSDKERLYQVLLNLATNAEKFTEKGRIEIRYDIQDTNIWFSIIDTGIGMDMETQKHIFERFRQGSDEYKTRKYGGTGLGLPIAKGILQGMEGDISVISEPGKGSIFRFYIPYITTAPKIDS